MACAFAARMAPSAIPASAAPRLRNLLRSRSSGLMCPPAFFADLVSRAVTLRFTVCQHKLRHTNFDKIRTLVDGGKFFRAVKTPSFWTYSDILPNGFLKLLLIH